MDRARTTANPETSLESTPAASEASRGNWREKYGDKHRLRRITEMPAGVRSPGRVRIYARREHYVLQWWDKRQRRTLNERIEGDLIDAIARAREIDERLKHFKSAGQDAARIGHEALINAFLDDLQRRADAGEIDVATVKRYASALGHYRAFTAQPDITRRFPRVSLVERTFQLEFTAFLNHVHEIPGGDPQARRPPLKDQAFVLDVVRGMFAWAADPQRGRLLPDGFRNPFCRPQHARRTAEPDRLSAPDINIEMAVELLQGCDTFQLTVFAPLLLYGLRPGELGWLFRDYVESDWLRVPCNLELDYATKGLREKSFPIPECLAKLGLLENTTPGLLYVHRRANRRNSPLIGLSLVDLVAEFRRRCAAAGATTALERRQLRNQLMKDAGQLNYDHVDAEFKLAIRRHTWPAAATLKDLRHLFASCLEDAGVPEFHRRYLMGHSFGRATIVAYTHISREQVRNHFTRALQGPLAPIVAAVEERTRQLRQVEASER